MRGEGTLLGVRQQGRSDLRLANLKRDKELLERAHEMAATMVEDGGAALTAMEDELRLFVDEDEAAYLFKS
jgi:ATP-dependent DNA helicase RecG